MTQQVKPITRADVIRLERKLDITNKGNPAYESAVQRWIELQKAAEIKHKAVEYK